MSANLTTALIPVGTAARPGIKRTGHVGVTIHNTGNYNAGAGALNHKKYMVDGSGKNVQASYHWVVDDKEAFNLIPEEEVSWHAGDGQGKGNYQTISIEICVNPDGDILKATDNAVELAKDIINRWGGNLYQHFDWSGKNCPAEIRAGNPYSWDTFKSKVFSQSHEDVAPKPTGRMRNVFNVDEVQNIHGLWQLRCDYLVPVEFNWYDNGIALEDITFVDDEGKPVSQVWDGTQKHFVFDEGHITQTGRAGYGSGGYYWIQVSTKGGLVWLSAWDVNDLIYRL